MKKRAIFVSAALATAVSAFAVVEKPSLQPRWSGASVAEWTMDYTAALKQAKAENKWSLMLYTGSWWCPWCQPLEAKVFDTDAWREYAAEKGYYEIEMDYPARNGTGNWCWLWDEDYLAANGLTESKATAALKDRYAQQDKYALPDAQKQVCTNGTSKVTYKRIGYPTILVLRPDGSVAGRFSPDVREYKDKDGNVTNHWSEADAFAAVTEQLEAIVDTADTHVVVSVAEGCAEMGKVTAVDKTVYTGTSIALKATANKGYYFAGWYEGGAPAETAADYRNASTSYVTKGGEAAIEACFVAAEGDHLLFDFSESLMAFPLNEEVSETLVVDSETFPTVTLSGLPKGLKFDAKTLTVSGTATTEGFYYVTASAKNASGYAYSQVVKCTVGEPAEPEPTAFDEYVDFSGLEGLRLGVAVEAELGVYSPDDKEGITGVSGLPAGLSSVKEADEDGNTIWFVRGTPTKAGLFAVTVKSTYQNDRKKAVNGSSKAQVAVESFPSQYISVSYGEGGTASGGGVYAALATASLSAKANRNFVFAGWLDGEGGEFVEDDRFDYRNPSLKLSVTEDVATTWFASFASSEADGKVEIVGEEFDDGGMFYVDPNDQETAISLAYSVTSVSLPTVKVSGLPAGFEASTSASSGLFTIAYDPSTAKKKPAPGDYLVKVTATNVSKASDTAEFTIRVKNLQDEHIAVEDVYPDEAGFTPGETIEPLDFSEAVAFDEGFTLDATGLPKGLTFNKRADARKGIEANTVTGKPTVPGRYTVTFTAKQGRTTYQATSTFVVAPFPTLSVNIVDDEEVAAAAGCKVTGTGGYMAGTKVTLKATAAKGWVFGGWEGVEGSAMALLNPSLSIVTGDEDAIYDARFLRICDDWLFVGPYNSGEEGDDADTLKLKVGDDVGAAANAIAALVDSGSLPTVSVSGLPAGVKFDAKTLMLSGKPTKAGVYYATVSAKNAGGYTFTRVVRIAVSAADGTEPVEQEEENTAGIDLENLAYIATGESVGFEFDVPGYGDEEVAVKSVSVSGLPKGLSSALLRDDDGNAYLCVWGIAGAAGRTTVKVAVTYANNKKANAVRSVIVEDSGSAYLFVSSDDEAKGTVTGEGVYAAGATVKLTAKAAKNHVFAGWWTATSVDEVTGEPLGAPFMASDADYRSASLSFAMTVDLADAQIAGLFVAGAEDGGIAIGVSEDVWDVVPDEDSAIEIDVDSWSLPTVTAGGLPKGIAFDKSAPRLTYSAADKSKLVPGVYTVTLNAQNVSKAKADPVTVTVNVPIPENEFFTGYGLDQGDGYAAQAGLLAGDALSELAETLSAMDADGLKVTAKNLPTGVKLTKVTEDGVSRYVLDGVPTKPGTFTVSFTATGTIEGTKVNETGMCFITVDAMPDALVGTFNGSVFAPDPYDYESEQPRSVSVGSLSVTVKADGKITAKVVRPTGTYQFSASSWDAISAGEGAAVELRDAKSRVLSLAVDFSDEAPAFQMSGHFLEDAGSGLGFECRAQRNEFAAGDAEALAAAEAVKGSYKFVALPDAETPSGHLYSYKFDQSASKTSTKLTVTVDAKGVVKFAGKYGAKSVSGSTVLYLGEGGGAPTMTAELVWKNDSESVGIATVSFVYDGDAGTWSLAEPDGVGATVEVYESDCASCED